MKLRNKKTGEIWELWQADTLHKKEDGFYEGDVERICLEMIDEDYDHYDFKYASLKELNEEWEDYKPKEPLIKDEKVRKAVRAWAEANDFMRVFYEYDYSNDIAKFMVGETKMIIESDELLEDCKNYTITELCGEEEE